ncbi:four helix bundle protein [Burkholderia gladioli]|uniref:four helix bundle protein n=1 Tax=Burkholderia gladioli TaxID=28095 RepID=UPI003AFB3AB2
MAIHTQLPIYRSAYALLDTVTDVVKNMPRDFKRTIGEKITIECIEIMVLVFRANVAADKSPHLAELLERLQVIELLLRLGMDKRLIARAAYAGAVEQTTSIGKQANGWKKSAERRPLHGGQGRHD